ncbi:MAG: tRNA epoxyqueuosine(34) reductase QueG [Gammaproteobacteria bacterium]|nr:tRNA epoxyqueuosine(34) reductase QueG [Gammaproteobacteria bacterium]
MKNEAYLQLADQIKSWGLELGFQQIGITDTELDSAEQHMDRWLEAGLHGDMEYMASHGHKRSRPQDLVPGTISVISARMDFLPPDTNPEGVLADPRAGYISRYALGRDYHKLIRNRLQKLAQRIQTEIGEYSYRVFTDSAPVLEKPLAAKAGLGWTGKNSLLVNRAAASWFFLGEIYTDLSLPLDTPEQNHCGTCDRCIVECPTQAIIAPYKVDARRCISYLTIELSGPIPEELRPLMGNRIYGCDDCLLACPWNRFTSPSSEQDFLPRNGLDTPDLIQLFAWNEQEFLKRLEGSAIRRLGHERWLRNIAIALGNADAGDLVTTALQSRLSHKSELVREHVAWALSTDQNT